MGDVGTDLRPFVCSPLNPDTDGDGLTDYEEVFLYDTE